MCRENKVQPALLILILSSASILTIVGLILAYCYKILTTDSTYEEVVDGIALVHRKTIPYFMNTPNVV